jgi:hypothetical protein
VSCLRAEKEHWREAKRDQLRELATTDEPLAHLLAVLDFSADLLREIGSDADAVVLDSHRAQLVAGKEWPGDKIVSPFPPDLKAVPQQEATTEGVFV